MAGFRRRRRPLKLYELTEALQLALSFEPELDEEDRDNAWLANLQDSLHGQVEEKLESCEKVRRALRAEGDAQADEITRLHARRHSTEGRIVRLKSYMIACLMSLPNHKHKTALFSLYLQKSPDKIVVEEEEALPTVFWRHPPREPNLVGLMAVFKKTGELPPGTELEKGRWGLRSR